MRQLRQERRAAGTVQGKEAMVRYRYRTPALAGRWRESREAAQRDAINAHQALADENAPGGLRWLVRGEIEEEESGMPLTERIQRH